MTTYNVVYEQAGDGSWSAFSPDLPGCYSVGDTVDEAEAGMREAVLSTSRSCVAMVIRSPRAAQQWEPLRRKALAGRGTSSSEALVGVKRWGDAPCAPSYPKRSRIASAISSGASSWMKCPAVGSSRTT